MAAGVRIFFVNRAGQHLDGSHEQRAVLLGSALQVGDEALQVLGHVVEGLSQFAELGAAGELHALREVAACDRPAGIGQDVKRPGDAALQLVGERVAGDPLDLGPELRDALVRRQRADALRKAAAARLTRAEAKERLTGVRPRSLGQAGRVPGVTPAAISILTVWCHRARPAEAAH